MAIKVKRNDQWVEVVSSNNSGGTVEIDATLTQQGKAADAKAVGEKLNEKTQVQIIVWEEGD